MGPQLSPNACVNRPAAGASPGVKLLPGGSG